MSSADNLSSSYDTHAAHTERPSEILYPKRMTIYSKYYERNPAPLESKLPLGHSVEYKNISHEIRIATSCFVAHRPIQSRLTILSITPPPFLRRQKGVRKRLSRAFVADYVCNNTFADAADASAGRKALRRFGAFAMVANRPESLLDLPCKFEAVISEVSLVLLRTLRTSRKMDRPRARKNRARPSSPRAVCRMREN